MTSKKKERQQTAVENKELSILDKISLKKGLLFSAFLIIMTLVIFYKPYVIDRLEPMGGDKIGAIGKTHQIREYSAKTGERALWNPNIFCGIPTYHRLSSNAFHLDVLIRFLHPVLDWKIGWFTLAGIGIFLIVLHFGFPWYFALIATVAFLFLPHFQALIEVGHDAKTMAIMAIPLVLYGFLLFIKRVDIFSLCVFVLAFSLQIRTQHYQIIFYTALLLFAVGVWTIVQWIREKKFDHLSKTLPLFLLGLVISVFMVAQPLFVVSEYTPESTRGGKAIHLTEKTDTEKQSGGVSFEYATRWSLSPKEILALIIPRIYGGTSSEPYTGKIYPQLKGRQVPGSYWGEMPMTQSSEYMGIITILLALIGIWYNRRNGLVISLSILLILTFLLAFGRHFPILYKLLFDYLPYFSKFRSPAMILTLTAFIFIILATFGLKELLEAIDRKKLMTGLFIAGFFAALGLILFLFPSILSFTSAKDAQLASNPQYLEMIRAIRREMMVQDTLRMLGFVVLFAGLLTAVYFRKINRDGLIIGIFLLIAIDMISVSLRFIKNAPLKSLDRIEQQYFRVTKYDQLIEQDHDKNRILALGNLFQSNDLAYRHQIIGGYSAIKPQLIQDIIENNIYTQNPAEPINWNVANMLNGRYIISPVQLNYAGLSVLDFNQQSKTILYKNENALPRVYFVKQIKILPDEQAVVRFLNRPDFNPVEMALVTEELESQEFSGKGKVSIEQYTPNEIHLKYQCDNPEFLVLSEAYYPKGWQATIDDKVIPIYQVNHILRGMVVPAGDHKLQLIFAPKKYYRSQWISSIFTYLVWLTLVVTYIQQNRQKLVLQWRTISRKIKKN